MTRHDVGQPSLRILANPPRAELSLVCFPGAGRSSLFASWAPDLHDSVVLIAADYGDANETRHDDPIEAVPALADRLAAAIPADERPTALFGHGFGAAVAFEVAHRLETAGAAVTTLFVSSLPLRSTRGLGSGGADHCGPTAGAKPALRCSIVAYLGTSDAEVRMAEMREWERCTTGPFALRLMRGGHFYLVPRRRELIADVLDHLLGRRP